MGSYRWDTRHILQSGSDVSWFYRADIQEAIPLFGTAAAKHRQLKLQHGITDGVDVFKKVMEGNRSSREGWFCDLPPPALATLPDRASIIGLAAARSHGAAGTVLPDAPPVAITASPAATAAVTAPVALVVPAAALNTAAAICTLSLAATRSWVIGRIGCSGASSFPIRHRRRRTTSRRRMARPSEAGRGSLMHTSSNRPQQISSGGATSCSMVRRCM